MTTIPETFEQWLDALILATAAERRMVAIDGSDAGLALRRVRCTRHNVALNWTAAYAHLDKTEGYHRLAEGEGTRLHQPGDLVPALDPRTTSTCSKCHRPVIWVATSTGGSLPVDFTPNPAGSVVLTIDPAEPAGKPLAMFLSDDSQGAPPESRHILHRQTCRTTRRGGRR